MKLSIITINYNNLQGLQKTINSVMSQTWRDFEWIIIDGGSTDGSKNLIEKLAQDSFSQISYWCSEPDKGIYNAMNKGISQAKGDYINFMNSGDCYVNEDVLKRVYTINQSADILYGDALWIFENRIEHRVKPDKFDLEELYFHSLYHQSCFIKRCLLVDGGYDETFMIASDWKRWIEWTLQNRTFYHLQFPVSVCDGLGISNTDCQKTQSERNEIWEALISPHIQKTIDTSLMLKDIFEQNPDLTLLNELINSRRFYKRIIHIFVKVLLWIRKVI